MVHGILTEQSVIRVAFTLLTGNDTTGTGNYNYLVNLVQVLALHAKDQVQPVLFMGIDTVAANVAPFTDLPGVQVIRTAEFDDSRKSQRLRQALLKGRDQAALRCFRGHRIDVLFENAQFYGWRSPFPTLAWIPDFQHRNLRELFSFRRYCKREAGFVAQVLSGRQIMLSSEDSRRDCERFYPQSVGRTSVVRFAVPPPHMPESYDARVVADGYALPKHFFYLPNQFWRHKNHRIVIEALHILKQQGNDIVVACSGKPQDPRHPDHYRELESLVGSLGLINNFRFLGMVPRDHVFALLRACTALINPSRCEGWSTSVEEAKSLGVPMLLSNLRVHVEQARENARFFDPDSACELSAQMALYHPMEAITRREAEHRARISSEGRVRQFAYDFVKAVQRAMSGSGEYCCSAHAPVRSE
jgi:glycosyltransferase involved in cell wall biosynthesis